MVKQLTARGRVLGWVQVTAVLFSLIGGIAWLAQSPEHASTSLQNDAAGFLRARQNHLKVETVWQPVHKDGTSSLQSHQRYIWSLLGLANDGSKPQTAVLRVHMGTRSNSRRLQEENDESPSDGATVDVVVVSFEDILKTIIFLTCTWLLGRLSHNVGMPSLVGEIMCGFLLGPPLADFCPFPEALVLIGTVGLIGLIVESGMDIDIAQLKESGPRAVVLALVGSVLPMAAGLGLGRVASTSDFRSAVAVGAAFAPSSLGVSSSVLSAGEVLNTPIGQLIVASSVVDDVLGLILLSILQVLVQDETKPFDFVLPFISSFGFLFFLGYLGVTWIPRIIEKAILPRIPERYRESGAVFLLFLLVIGYMPLLNYTKASYLTGAFLAGLSFSQIHSVHASYARNAREVLSWLMRVFFAATIGFQVPVRFFKDPYVLKWGAKFMVPVLAKMPLGLLVPNYRKGHLPDDFPYNPFWRDALVVSFAMVCRGEFNFIIAAFSLSNGLLTPQTYSALVLANLLASIMGPLMLSKTIEYYNELSRKFMSGSHPIMRKGNTCDGYRPLFLAIQARTPVTWGLQDSFDKALEEAGVMVMDHRYWHTLGMDAVGVTEIFAQDSKTNVTVTGCFSKQRDPSLRGAAVPALPVDGDAEDEASTTDSFMEVSSEEEDSIARRCEEIKQVLLACLGPSAADTKDYAIKVSQWQTFTFDDQGGRGRADSHVYTFNLPEDTGVPTDDAGEGRARANSHNSLGRARANSKGHSRSNSHVSYALSIEDQDTPLSGNGKKHSRSNSHVSFALSIEDQDSPLPGNDNASNFSLDSEVVDVPGPSASQDLWDEDERAHDCVRNEYYMTPCEVGVYDVSAGVAVAQAQNSGHVRRKTFDASLLHSFQPDLEQETFLIKERLHGYVRGTSGGGL